MFKLKIWQKPAEKKDTVTVTVPYKEDNKKRNSQDIVTAAVAVGAPVIAVEKQMGAVKLTLGISAEAWEKTGGETSYKYRLDHALGKVERLHVEFPGIVNDRSNIKSSENQVKIKRDPLTQRFFFQVTGASERVMKRIKTLLGGHWNETAYDGKSFTSLSEPSSSHYNTEYSPVGLGLRYIEKAVHAIVPQAQIKRVSPRKFNPHASLESQQALQITLPYSKDLDMTERKELADAQAIAIKKALITECGANYECSVSALHDVRNVNQSGSRSDVITKMKKPVAVALVIPNIEQYAKSIARQHKILPVKSDIVITASMEPDSRPDIIPYKAPPEYKFSVDKMVSRMERINRSRNMPVERSA